jgi:hypothetical protein
VSPDAHSPAERADAVLRAAEAAAAAAQATAAAHAASPPGPPDVPPAPEPPSAASPTDAPEPPPGAHVAGAPARLLAAAGELEASVAQARAQLDALDDALERLGQPAARPQ